MFEITLTPGPLPVYREKGKESRDAARGNDRHQTRHAMTQWRLQWRWSLFALSVAAFAVAPFSATRGTQAADHPAPSTAPLTLRQAAGDRLLIGAAVRSTQLQQPNLAALVAGQFNCITAENEFKPQSLQPEPGRFNFEPADKIIEFAQRHDIKVVGHTLCWHSQSPRWMFADERGQPLPRDKALANLKAHIDTVAGHFKGKVIGWDVVNEAISEPPGQYLRNSPARRAIGDDFVIKAFEFAHAADPDAQLYYNDFNDEEPVKREKTIRLIRDLKSNGCRIDAVGIQGHWILNSQRTEEVLEQAITAYAAEGVKVMITELDVDVLPRRTSGADINAREQGGAPNLYPNGLPADVAQSQADFYRRLFAVVARHPGVVTRVTFWGTHDGTSWLNNWPVRGRSNHPLLWDRDLQAKPAFDAVLTTLAGI